MKKYIVAAAAAVCAVMFGSCGAVDIGSSSVADVPVESSAPAADSEQVSEESNAQTDDTTTQPSQTDTQTEPVSQPDESSEPDSSSEDFEQVSGYFIEKTDGVETNYIIIGENASYISALGETTGAPLLVTQTADGILVNRGGTGDFTDPSPYSYDGSVLTFEQGGHSYEWSRIDFIPAHGTYNVVDEEGNFSDIWQFNGDGTGSLNGEDIAYTQSEGAMSVSYADGSAVDYSCAYDVFSLTLTADDGTVISMRAANS